MSFITIGGESAIAEKMADDTVLTVSQFVFAYIEGLGVEPVDRNESLPAASNFGFEKENFPSTFTSVSIILDIIKIKPLKNCRCCCRFSRVVVVRYDDIF